MKTSDRLLFSGLSPEKLQVLTVYGEARGEGEKGRVAIAHVIKNRHDFWKKEYTDICLAKNQFSCFLANDPNFPVLKDLAATLVNLEQGHDAPFRNKTEEAGFVQCMYAVQKAAESSDDITRGATFYRVEGTRNTWFDGAVKKGTLKKTITIGRHEFFTEGGKHEQRIS